MVATRKIHVVRSGHMPAPERRRRSRLAAALVIALLLIHCAGIAAAQRSREFSAKVVRVIDGDTIDVLNGRTVRVRLEGIDCPEPKQPFSQVARNFTRQLLFDQTVIVHPVATDRYGRTVARVLVAGKDASVELARAGLAWHYTDYSSDPVLAAAEAGARTARRGLWLDPHPSPPWVARRAPGPASLQRSSPSVTGPFHGNTQSHVFHVVTCKNYACRNCTVVFRTVAEAEAAGYHAAGDCLRTSR